MLFLLVSLGHLPAEFLGFSAQPFADPSGPFAWHTPAFFPNSPTPLPRAAVAPPGGPLSEVEDVAFDQVLVVIHGGQKHGQPRGWFFQIVVVGDLGKLVEVVDEFFRTVEQG